MCGLTITTGATCFLVVRFDGTGYAHMSNPANVRLVDTHTVGIGGDEYRRLIALEGTGHLALLLVWQLSVVRADPLTRPVAQLLGDRLHAGRALSLISTCSAKDDSTV